MQKRDPSISKNGNYIIIKMHTKCAFLISVKISNLYT